ncbi:MAG: type IV secretion system protein [Phenylobacterium sp.]|jgi:type IV secretion system protein VirB5|uniref:type IV secretion system protein n=1 Tax=Phenylobacterium sp. TaxID=1871053 RepID=UPI001801690A|nr:type IV secretion system protein [Phenylobacterium sp.]MBA4794545.1 type IV secretion system protein [Phenylobacterium sp.]
MRRPILLTATALLVVTAAAPVRAEMVVTDPGAYAKMLDQIREAQAQLSQLQEQVRQGTEIIGQGQRLYDSLNQISNVNSIGGLLNTPAVRTLLPAELSDARRLMSGDLQDLGSLASRATTIRDSNRIYSPTDSAGISPAEQFYRDTLEKAGVRAARDMAVGERVTQTADQRLQGLEQLREALSTAPNARAVLDLQARIDAETAMIQNDQMRLQGVAIMQAADERLEAQRLREASAKRHDEAQAFWRSLYSK